MATLNNSTDTKIIILKGKPIMVNFLLVLTGICGVGFVVLNELTFSFKQKKELFKANLSFKLGISCGMIAAFSIFTYILLTA